MAKKKIEKKKSNAGRPPKITAAVVQKLEGCFRRGLSDEMACLASGISMSALYVYQQAHPEFVERKKLLKSNIKMRAREIIADKIEEGDHEIAKWLLERRDEEFKPKMKNDFEGGLTITGLFASAVADEGATGDGK